MDEEVLEIQDTEEPLVEHHPEWLITVYTKLWENTENYLTIDELFTRPIDPESPRWYMLPINENTFDARLLCWNVIKKELYSQLKKSQQDVEQVMNGQVGKITNSIAYQNAATLSFLLNEFETSFKITDTLVTHEMNTSLLRTVSYFFIMTNQFSNAAAILYHLLDQDTIDFHAIYLLVRLISRHLEFESEELHHLNNEEMIQFRDELIETVHHYKPKNHLYKLYKTYYVHEQTNTFTEQEMVQLSKRFLRRILKPEEKEEKGVVSWWKEWSSSVKIMTNILGIIITILGFATVTRTLSFRKKDKKFQAIQDDYYKAIGDKQFTKDDLEYTYPSPLQDTPIRTYIRPFVPKGFEDDEPMQVDKLLVNDFEYVNNLYDEIKAIADEGLRKEPKKKEVKIKQARPLVTVTTGEGILDENVEKEEQVKSVVKKAAAKAPKKVPKKKATSSTTNVGTSGVKVFGSKKR